MNPDDVDRAMQLIGDKVHIFDKWQTPKWGDTRQLIKEEVMGQGVQDVYLDPLSNFTLGMSGSERNYGYTAHVFCHFNKAPKGDKQWNDGRVPSSDDFQGSGAMAQACHMMIGMQGWKITSGDEKEFLNGKRIFHILEEREYGVSDSIELQWHGSQGRLKEITDE